MTAGCGRMRSGRGRECRWCCNIKFRSSLLENKIEDRFRRHGGRRGSRQVFDLPKSHLGGRKAFRHFASHKLVKLASVFGWYPKKESQKQIRLASVSSRRKADFYAFIVDSGLTLPAAWSSIPGHIPQPASTSCSYKTALPRTLEKDSAAFAGRRPAPASF